ncbi:hypothetical protein SAMN05421863_1005113 [Nitrosomonas communis]|uniref:Uncharacterized protein n=1 Tax=Nitrosomonas communis TaxID=44574 RepID=A0A1I4L1S5_9PROT|nr:hypothetical protein SAMN05421863_1005113 [Nitrosomonas communis]
MRIYLRIMNGLFDRASNYFSEMGVVSSLCYDKIKGGTLILVILHLHLLYLIENYHLQLKIIYERFCFSCLPNIDCILIKCIHAI